MAFDECHPSLTFYIPQRCGITPNYVNRFSFVKPRELYEETILSTYQNSSFKVDSMEKCKLKKGDRIYECRYQQAILTELITDPEFIVQGDGDRFWHWKARIVKTGDIIEYWISEESPEYEPKLFRKDLYKYGYCDAEPVLPPFDTSMD